MSTPHQAPTPTNTLAIITLVAAFLLPPAGIVTGHIALKQIRGRGEGGDGIAKLGLILSYFWTALVVIVVGLFASAVGLMLAFPTEGTLPS